MTYFNLFTGILRQNTWITILSFSLFLSKTMTLQAQYKAEVIGGNAENISATITSLNEPTKVALDASGNILIADAINSRIRKIDVATGNISTIAGTGEFGTSGDGGLATKAQLKSPIDLAIDASGNIYILDLNGNNIRKVDANTGIITTIAGTGEFGFSGDGGPATAARFDLLSGIALDASGNIFITDKRNLRIRKIDATTGNISTIAGNGTQGFSGDGGSATTAQLHSPAGIVIDASGNIFFADQFGYRLRKIDAITGNISTIAGNGTQGQSGDGGLATAAQLNLPRFVNIDASGNIYITDFNKIRKLDATTGNISTIAGTGIAGYSGDGGLATMAQFNTLGGVDIDASGNIFIADIKNHRVRKIDATTGNISTIAGNGNAGYAQGYTGDGGAASNAQFNRPEEVVVDGFGNVYIADRYNHRIRKIDASTGNISTIAGTGVAGFSGDGGIATTAQLNNPSSISIDASGNIFISDTENHRIRKIDVSTGIISTFAGTGVDGYSGDGGTATNARLNNPRFVAIDASGNLFIADMGNHRIRKVDVNTYNMSTIAGTGVAGYSGDGGIAVSAQLDSPNAIFVDTSGNIFIADTENHRIRKVDATTSSISTVVGTGEPGSSGNFGLAINAKIASPKGIYVGISGDIFFTDQSSNSIRKVDASTGKVFRVVGINRPIGLSVNRLGIIYSTDLKSSTIIKFTPLRPEIGLKENTKDINNGDTKAFGATGLGITKRVTFTIENTGENILNISELSVSGEFRITSGSSLNSVAIGGTADITISMNASSAGVKTGTLTIESDDFDEATYTVSLSGTVNKADQVISFNLGNDSTKVMGDPDFTLNATGGNSGNQVTFTSSDSNVATISGTTVTIVGAGTTVITASQAGDANYNAALDVTQTLTVATSNVTGLTSTLIRGELRIYPNPVIDQLNLRFSGNVGFGSNNKVSVQVYNATGQKITTYRRTIDPSGKLVLNMSNLPASNYLLVITLPNAHQIQRRIIKK